MAKKDPRTDDEPLDDGIPDWEPILPEVWLKPPHFSKDVDVWICEVQTIIQAGRAKKGLPEKLVDDNAFHALKEIVAKYIKIHREWESYRTAIDKAKLRKLKSPANSLLVAIRGLKDADRDPTWYLEAMLHEAPGKWSLDALTGALECVAQLEFRSPKLGGPQSKGVKSPAQMKARGYLQIWVDWWWWRHSRLPLAADAPKARAFHDFLAATFGPINLRNAPSHSKTAILKARQAHDADRKEKMRTRVMFMKRIRAAPYRTPIPSVLGGTLP